MAYNSYSRWGHITGSQQSSFNSHINKWHLLPQIAHKAIFRKYKANLQNETMVAAIMLKFKKSSLPSNATLTFQFVMEMLKFWEELTSMQHAACF